MFRLTLRMKTESPNRIRGTTVGARMGHAAKIASQRDSARAHILAALGRSPPPRPVLVELTRISAGTLDDDNLRGALKATRDGISKGLGFADDSHPEIRFVYAQRRAPRGTYAVEVVVKRG